MESNASVIGVGPFEVTSMKNLLDRLGDPRILIRLTKGLPSLTSLDQEIFSFISITPAANFSIKSGPNLQGLLTTS